MKKNKENPEYVTTLLTVKAVVLNKNGKILVLKRPKKGVNFSGMYDLPGGHIDKGESVEECLIREIQEETGLEVRIGDILSVEEYPKSDEMFDKKKALRFIAYAESDEVEITEEHDSFEWLAFEEAIKKIGKEGYEGEKRKTLIKAQEYLEMQKGLDGWKRCLAEFENYKKIQAESNKDTIRYASENLVLQILPVIDNFSSSVDHIPEDQKEDPWVKGIMYIKKQLEDVLKENGVEEINVKPGDNFNTATCEAIEAKSEGRKVKGDKIEKIILKGYKIEDKIIRPAKVTVK